MRFMRYEKKSARIWAPIYSFRPGDKPEPRSYKPDKNGVRTSDRSRSLKKQMAHAEIREAVDYCVYNADGIKDMLCKWHIPLTVNRYHISVNGKPVGVTATHTRWEAEGRTMKEIVLSIEGRRRPVSILIGERGDILFSFIKMEHENNVTFQALIEDLMREHRMLDPVYVDVNDDNIRRRIYHPVAASENAGSTRVRPRTESEVADVDVKPVRKRYDTSSAKTVTARRHHIIKVDQTVRRGHYRTKKDGSKVWVRETIVHYNNR